MIRLSSSIIMKVVYITAVHVYTTTSIYVHDVVCILYIIIQFELLAKLTDCNVFESVEGFVSCSNTNCN